MSYQFRLVASLAVVLAFYVASNYAAAALVPAIYGLPCDVVFLSTHCAFPPDTVASQESYVLLASLIATSLIAMHLFWRDAVAYPFFAMIGVLCLATIALDRITLNPVINSPKIINDTINILGAVIAASFVLLLAILRRHAYTLPSLIRAAGASYLIKVLSVTFFIAISTDIHGATELFLLYVVYAFGAFSLHLMTVSGFVARTAVTERRAFV